MQVIAFTVIPSVTSAMTLQIIAVWCHIRRPDCFAKRGVHNHRSSTSRRTHATHAQAWEATTSAAIQMATVGRGASQQTKLCDGTFAMWAHQALLRATPPRRRTLRHQRLLRLRRLRRRRLRHRPACHRPRHVLHCVLTLAETVNVTLLKGVIQLSAFGILVTAAIYLNRFYCSSQAPARLSVR